MEHRQIIFLFLTGALPLVLSVTRKYYLIQQMKTWPDAQLYCQNNHTDLAIIESDSDRVRFQDEVTSKQFTSSAWTGLYEDLKSWRWSLGNVTLGSWTMWSGNQPDSQPRDQCVAIHSDGYWSDENCMNRFYFLCIDERNTGLDRNVFYGIAKTWQDAQTYCREHHTDLASSLNSVDNADIVTQIAGKGQTNWIGLFRDSWKWSDQTFLPTINWIPGLPYQKANAHCGLIQNNQYGNAACSDLMLFFCYSVVTGQRQRIRIKVASDQDVEDPVAKAAILEKIQQMLMEREVREISTLKWIKDAEGNVFHKIITL